MLKFIKNLFKHRHYYSTYHPVMCRYASCTCGCSISIDEAIIEDIPIHLRESGQIIIWKPEYIVEMKRRYAEDEVRRNKRLEV